MLYLSIMLFCVRVSKFAVIFDFAVKFLVCWRCLWFCCGFFCVFFYFFVLLFCLRFWFYIIGLLMCFALTVWATVVSGVFLYLYYHGCSFIIWNWPKDLKVPYIPVLPSWIFPVKQFLIAEIQLWWSHFDSRWFKATPGFLPEACLPFRLPLPNADGWRPFP